jgi:hypothetical protein
VDHNTDILNEAIFPGNAACYDQAHAAISTGTVMAFTGAGTSTPLYPTWTRLLKDLMAEAGQEGLANGVTLHELNEMLSDDPLEVATHLEDLFTARRFRGRLAERFAPSGDPNKMSISPHRLASQVCHHSELRQWIGGSVQRPIQRRPFVNHRPRTGADPTMGARPSVWREQNSDITLARHT